MIHIDLNHREINIKDVLEWSKNSIKLIGRMPINFLIAFFISAIPVVVFTFVFFIITENVMSEEPKNIELFIFSLFYFSGFSLIILYDTGSYILTRVADIADNDGGRISWFHEISVIFFTDGLKNIKSILKESLRYFFIIFMYLSVISIIFSLAPENNNNSNNKIDEISQNKEIVVKKEKTKLESVSETVSSISVLLFLSLAIRISKINPLYYTLIQKGLITLERAEKEKEKRRYPFILNLFFFTLSFIYLIFIIFSVPILAILTSFIFTFSLSFYWTFNYVAARDLFLGKKENEEVESKNQSMVKSEAM